MELKMLPLPKKLVRLHSFLGVTFAVCVIVCASCPINNMTDQELLKENRGLRELYQQFSVKTGGKINLDGLKNLITKLYIITSCPEGGRERAFMGGFPTGRDRYSTYHDDYHNRRDYDGRRNYDRNPRYPDYHDVLGPFREPFGKFHDSSKDKLHDNTAKLHDLEDQYQDDSAQPLEGELKANGVTPRPDKSKGIKHPNNEEKPRYIHPDSDFKGYHDTEDPYRSKGDPYRSKGDPYRSKGDPYRSKGDPYRSLGDPYRSFKDPYRSKGDYDNKRLDLQYPNYKRGPYPKGYMTQNCETIESAILNSGIVKEDIPLGPHDFLHLCPYIVKAILNPPCDAIKKSLRMMVSRTTEHGYDERSHNHHHRHYEDYDYQMTRDSWIGAILSLILIGLIALLCILVIPVLKTSKYYIAINHFLLSLAVGSLAGDALIHLLPHAFTMEMTMNISAHLAHALYGFTAFFGIMVFLLMERLHNLIGHKHSHTPTTKSAEESDDMAKEIGVISSSEMNDGNPKHAAKIGKKLSQHSKTSSFTHVEASSDNRSCFDSCPPNRGSGIEDSNSNTGFDSIRKPRLPERHSSSTAERERLVAVNQELMDKVSSTKGIKPTPIPPPPLIQSSPPKPIVRQDSKNFNMVLDEYHIGHHGHSHHGHSHVTGKKDSLRTMILLGDGIHTFIDGMAIGAAYGTSLTGGIATAIAVLCHELPHKVGDFAILFEMGMKRNQALKMVFILWLLSFCGLAVGVSLGSIQSVSPWIYCFTAGIFLYLALVDLLAELSINESGGCSAAGQMMLQFGGMMTGALIMLVIAIYEHDLENFLEGTFDTRDLAERRYYNRDYHYNPKYYYNRRP